MSDIFDDLLGLAVFTMYALAWAVGIGIGCYVAVTTGAWWMLLVAAALVAIPAKIWWDTSG